MPETVTAPSDTTKTRHDSHHEPESRTKPRKSREWGFNRAGEETVDAARDLPFRVVDEAGKLLRGLTFGVVEGARVAGDALNDFADEVLDRNQPEREQRATDEEEEHGQKRRGSKRRTIADLTLSLPADVFSAAISAMDRSLDIPSASVERFHSGYKEAEREAEPTLRDRRRDRERRSPISEEPAEVHGKAREHSQARTR